MNALKDARNGIILTNKDTESSSKSEDKAWRWWGYRKGRYDRLLGISLFVLIIMGGAFTSCIENIEYFTTASIKEHLDLLPSALYISAFFVVIYSIFVEKITNKILLQLSDLVWMELDPGGEYSTIGGWMHSQDHPTGRRRIFDDK